MPSDARARGGDTGALLDSGSEAAARTIRADERAREEALINRCLDGDREAFRPLVERYSSSLHAFALRYTGDRDAARDVVQDSFLRAFRSLADFDPAFRFSTWLYRIALNRCRDHAKRRAMSSQVEAAAGLQVAPPAERSVELRLDDQRLCTAAMQCLGKLPPSYREPVLLKDVELLDYKEISRITGLPVGLLKIRVMRGRRKLAAAMTMLGYVPEDER